MPEPEIVLKRLGLLMFVSGVGMGIVSFINPSVDIFCVGLMLIVGGMLYVFLDSEKEV